MISDEEVKQLFLKGQAELFNERGLKREVRSQLFWGKSGSDWLNQHPGGCKRHMTVFLQFNAIPRYCFDCYKVSIELQTVVELFKLMVFFEKLDLPDDNTRKCMVETREQMSGSYKGYIFCRGRDEGEKILNMVLKPIKEEISNKASISVKRGCSEYALAYPEYTKIGQGTKMMEYNETWQVYEDLVDKNFVIDPERAARSTYNRSTYTLDDAVTMFYWLQYAATIGDTSYLKISDKTIPPWPNFKRPSPFIQAESNQKKSVKKVGRNEPCICGSGKKYKRCCG